MDTAPNTPRFAIDRMLGRLARWLRLLGFDAIYRPELEGRDLLTLAAREGRVLLTRNRRLVRVPSTAEVVCLSADRFREQLAEIDAIHPLAPCDERPGRCAECNAPVDEIPADAVPARVPECVRATQQSFWRCARCRRVYWKATHWERMRGEIERLHLHSAAATLPREPMPGGASVA